MYVCIYIYIYIYTKYTCMHTIWAWLIPGSRLREEASRWCLWPTQAILTAGKAHPTPTTRMHGWMDTCMDVCMDAYICISTIIITQHDITYYTIIRHNIMLVCIYTSRRPLASGVRRRAAKAGIYNIANVCILLSSLSLSWLLLLYIYIYK